MNDFILMKQRVNLTDDILQVYQNTLKRTSSYIASKFLFKPEHINKIITFIDDGVERVFNIFGMMENEHIILSENINNEIIYWETTYQLIQHKLGLFNKVLNDNNEDVILQYPKSIMYLNNKKRKKQSTTVKEVEDDLEDDLEDDPISLFKD